MRLGKKRIQTVLIGVCAALTVSVVPLNPAAAEPTLDEVKTKVEQLYAEAEQATERYNDARVLRTNLERGLAAVQADEAAQKQVVDSIEGAVDQAITAQYEGHALSATGHMVTTEDPGLFLDQLTRLSAYNDAQADTLSSYDRAKRALVIRREAVAARTAEVAAVSERLEKEKAEVQAKLAEAKRTLSTLRAAEMRRYVSSVSKGTVLTGPPVAASGRAGAAIQFAMAQLGEMYLWGAAGPDRWDCSGLTMMAWRQGGKRLPHFSGAQYDAGTPIAISSARPGDLLFWSSNGRPSGIHHVALYLGNNQLIEAPRAGLDVRIRSLDYWYPDMAVRL